MESKKQSKKNKFVKICPKCGSTNIEFEVGCSDSKFLMISLIGNPIINEYCRDCGFGKYQTEMFKLPLVKESEVKEFRRKLELKSKRK